jgi:hypothetical protein
MLRTSITAWSARCHSKTFGTLRSRVKSRLPDHEKPLVTADFVNPGNRQFGRGPRRRTGPGPPNAWEGARTRLPLRDRLARFEPRCYVGPASEGESPPSRTEVRAVNGGSRVPK